MPDMSTMAQIRRYYGVPAKRGARVRFRGDLATITSAETGAMHLRIRLDKSPKKTVIVHPTWEMEYDVDD